MQPSLVLRLGVIVVVTGAGCVEPRQNPLVDREDAGEVTLDDAGASPGGESGDAGAGPDGPIPDGPLAPDLPPSPDGATDLPPPGDGPPGKLPVGKSCRAGADCTSGTCADGVCCATACTGACTSCAAADTGGADGTCAPVMAGKDSRNDCAAGTPPCGQDGACDGTGKCRAAEASVSCGGESCSGGRYTPEAHCDGKGLCATPPSVSCGNYPCMGTRCTMNCSAASPCIEGFYCDAGKCVARKAMGTSCNGNEECSSSVCAQGVCCDRACGAKCYSCLASATGAAQGVCAPVKAGLDPHNSCTAAAASSCREDGTCDGTGACRLFPSGTACRAEQCTDGATSSTYLPGATCNGNGTCMDLASGSTCPGYRCGSTRCKTSCNGNGDCSFGFYCDTAAHCVPKKGLGIACGNGDECGTGICGGRCCSTACTCFTQGSANKLSNAGFDKDVDGWTLVPPAYVSHYKGVDGTDCFNYSGVALLKPDAKHPDTSNAAIVQCVPATAGTTYNFGGRVQSSMVAIDWNGWCTLSFWKTLNDCTNAGTFQALASKQIAYYHDIKQTFFWYDFTDSLTAPAQTSFARLDCDTVDDSAMDPWVYLDNLYVSVAPAKF